MKPLTKRLYVVTTVGLLLAVLVDLGCKRSTIEPIPYEWQRPYTIRLEGFSGVGVFEHSGHQYIVYYSGGLIHSESCTNKACVPIIKEDFQMVPYDFLLRPHARPAFPVSTNCYVNGRRVTPADFRTLSEAFLQGGKLELPRCLFCSSSAEPLTRCSTDHDGACFYACDEHRDKARQLLHAGGYSFYGWRPNPERPAVPNGVQMAE